MKTTSYEISKKLKEAGFNTPAEKCWAKIRLSKTQEFTLIPLTFDVFANCDEWFPSYDLETLLDALPKINKQEYLLCSGGIVYLNDDYISVGKEKNESLADTAGKMWLLLKEKLGRKAS